MLELLIQDARICDGTGRPMWRGSLGVEGGRIAWIGSGDPPPAETVIDAKGLVLAPGFIDPHTHYDAQVCWDPELTPSSWHGVTTVVIGNCGVSVAPAKEDTRRMLLRDLENVEGIPYEVMDAAIPWQWGDFGEYLDFLTSRGLAINVAPMLSLTAIRHFVLGEESSERAATAGEIDRMCGVLAEALSAGAFGFSTDYLNDHIGYRGRPLACQLASREELVAFSRVLRQAGTRSVSLSVDSMRAGTRLISDEDVALLKMFADESEGIVTFIPVLSKEGQPNFHEQTLEKLGSHVGRVVPQSAVLPLVFVQTLAKPFKFGYYDSFRKVMNRPAAEQLAIYRSPDWRREACAELDAHERTFPFERTRILWAADPSLSSYVGRMLTDIAGDMGLHPLETLVELGCRDELKLRYEVEKSNHDQDGIAWMLGRSEFLVGLSDGGAHVDQICDSRYPSVMLGRWVREREVLDVETAVKKMTSVPAAVFGVPDRGVLAEGMVADLVLFDPETVSWEAPYFVDDLPLGADRLISRSTGIAATFVAGKQVSRDGELTGERPGTVLQCGRA